VMSLIKGLPIAAKVVGGAVALILALLAITFLWDLFTGTAKIEAKLGTEQADAAIESGQDAVNTVGENQSEERQIDESVEETQEAVDDAADAAGADAAGRNGLCVQFNICDEE